ncbi:MAG TPA: tripartite tricarboxylate transporter TctB family protein [Chloroflexota bacterium]|nr:tripartite tricarboxylate transporter TctB family protein [Chloroflexota bacterium]
MKRADQISGIVLLGLCLVTIYESSKLDMIYRGAPGPGFFPFWLAIVGALVSVLIVIGGIRRPAALNRSIRWPAGKGLTKILATFAALIVYILAINLVGYILSTVALFVFEAWMLGRYRWYQVAIVSLLASVGLYVLFSVCLQMLLPTGQLIIP